MRGYISMRPMPRMSDHSWSLKGGNGLTALGRSQTAPGHLGTWAPPALAAPGTLYLSVRCNVRFLLLPLHLLRLILLDTGLRYFTARSVNSIAIHCADFAVRKSNSTAGYPNLTQEHVGTGYGSAFRSTEESHIGAHLKHILSL